MILPTEEVRQYLEENGVARDDSGLYSFAGYQGDDEGFLVLDEAFAIQEIEMLIEDAEANVLIL